MVIRKVLKPDEAIENVKTVKEFSQDTDISDIDSILLGSYQQGDINGKVKEPIEWVVLCKDESEHRALLLSKYVLDVSKISNGNEYKWSTCDLRKWLNNEFYTNAFSELERNQIIVKTEIENRTSFMDDEVTNDYVFCLSDEDIKKYFVSSGTGNFYDLFDKVRSTEYAKNIFYKTSEDVAFVAENGFSPYVLRTPCNILNAAKYPMYVHSSNGLVENQDSTYQEVYSKNMCGIRPSIWIHY